MEEKMNKPRFFSVLIVFLSILLLVNPGFTAENNKVRELGEKELSKYLVKCGDSWYIKRITAGLVELRREGSIDLREMVLSESDKLNGLEFKGVLVFSYYGPSRQFNSWDNNTWGKWGKSRYFIDIIIIKQNSQWSIDKSNDLFRGATYTTISCNDLPRKELKLITGAVPIESLDTGTKSKPEEVTPSLTEEDVKTIKLKIIKLLEKAKTETSSAYSKLLIRQSEGASIYIDDAIKVLEEAIKATNEISNHQLKVNIETLKSRLEQAKEKNLLVAARELQKIGKKLKTLIKELKRDD